MIWSKVHELDSMTKLELDNHVAISLYVLNFALVYSSYFFLKHRHVCPVFAIVMNSDDITVMYVSSLGIPPSFALHYI